MASAPIRRLICGDHRCGKTTILADTAAELLAADYRSGQLLALSVHRHAVRGLRAALGERTGADVPAADVRRRATALLEQFPEAANLPRGWKTTDIISAIDRRMLMHRAWSSAGAEPASLYSRYGQEPGALDWLARVFDAFAEWSGTADPDRLTGHIPDDPALAELWPAYLGYLRLSQRLGLVAFQEVLPRALDALRDERVREKVVPRALLLDDLELFRPSELLFARALAGAETAVIAAVSAAPAAHSPDPQARYLADWCTELGLPLEASSSISTPEAGRNISYAECLTPEHEVAAIARHIATSVPPGGRLADYAIVSFDPDLLPLIRRTLPRWGIAVEGMEPRDAYTLAIAPLLHAGMRLIAGLPLPPEELGIVLRHPVLGLPPADSHLVVAALDGYPSGARAGIGDDALSVLQRSWPRELSGEGRLRLRQIVAVTEELRRANARPSAKLRRWVSRLGLDEAAAEQTSTALDPWAASADNELLDRWLGFLERSEQIRDALHEPLDDAEAVDVLASSQALVEPVGRRLADAVQIWQPDQLGGCSAGTVWITGLHEHALPRPSAPLPWAEPEAFAAAFNWLPGCIAPEQDDRAARWQQAREALERAAGRAGQTLVVSWSTADHRGHRRLRSPVLQEFPGSLADGDGFPVRSLADAAPGIRSATRPAAVEPMLTCGPALPEAGTLPPTPVFQTSPSAIEDYLNCPRRYFYARVLGLFDVVSSPRQAFGQVVHAVLHELPEVRDPSLDVAALVERYWPRSQHRFGTRLREAVFRQMAEQAVSQVATYEGERSDGTTFLAAEASFRWQMAPDVELRGMVDRIDRGPEGLVVLDYKLGADSPSINALLEKFAPPTDTEARAVWRPSDLQLPLYALAIERGDVEGVALEPGERVVEVGLVYPLQLYTAKGKAAAAGRRMIRIVDHTPDCTACGPRTGRSPATGTLCRDELQTIAERAMQAIEEMRGGNIDPDPRDGARTCSGCPFRAICPAPRA